ncbi:MAG: undecaprenyl-phosphate glucose phosphotransferase [Hyphomicrobiaceae bacterium]
MSRTSGEAGKDPQARWSRQVAADLVGLADAVAIELGAVLPAIIYKVGGGVVVNWTQVAQTGIISAIIAVCCLRSWGLYDTSRMNRFPIEPMRLFAALLLSFAAVHGIGLPFSPGAAHSWIWYAVWLSASFTLILWSRMMARMILARYTSAGRFDTRVAVFGAGAIARRVHDYLADPALGISFVGVYDDRQGQQRLNPEGLDVDGRLEDLIDAGRAGRVDQIIIALPQAADRRAAEVAKKLAQLPLSLHVVTHIASDLVDSAARHRVSNLGPVGLLDVKRKPLADWAPLVKRVEDYGLGALLLVLCAPLLLLCAIAIKVDSTGPVFFRQRRRGLNQQVIEVLKFRSMTVMEDGPDVKQATKNDARITRVGRFLRRSSLDELPQLLNVIKGEMSLVGPRPHALVHDEHWGEMLESYANRHQVKPGMTGLAQVMGWRGETETPAKMQARVEHDLAYIADWSLGQDFRILAQTVRVVVRGDNAN